MNRLQVPNDWEQRQLGDICEVLDHLRIPINSDDRYDRQGTIPYYGANGQVGWIDDFIFDEDLVLIAEDGGFFDEYATRPIAYRIQGKSWVNNHAHVLRASECTTNAWIFWNVVHKDIRRYIRGGTRSKLNQSELHEIEIPFCSLDEQRLIAEILDTVDDAIHHTEQLIGKLKMVRAGLLHDLLTCGIDDNGELRDPVRHPEQFKESELGLIPREWEVSSVLAKFNIQSGFTLGSHRHPRNNPRPYLRVANVQRDQLLLSDLLELEASDKEMEGMTLEVDDLLIVEGHANPNEIGRCARVTMDAVGLTFQNHLFRLRSREMQPRFALEWLNSEWVRRYWRNHCGTSSGLNTINQSMLRTLPVVSISQAEQMQILEVVNATKLRLAQEEASADKLKQIKLGLMDDLLTGQVRVVTLLEQTE